MSSCLLRAAAPLVAPLRGKCCRCFTASAAVGRTSKTDRMLEKQTALLPSVQMQALAEEFDARKKHLTVIAGEGLAPEGVDAATFGWTLPADSDVPAPERTRPKRMALADAIEQTLPETRAQEYLFRHSPTLEDQERDLLETLVHTSSFSRVKLPPTLASKAPTPELRDVAFLLDKNESMTPEVRERIYKGVEAAIMTGELARVAEFPPPAANGRWMRLVDTSRDMTGVEGAWEDEPEPTAAETAAAADAASAAAAAAKKGAGKGKASAPPSKPPPPKGKK